MNNLERDIETLIQQSKSYQKLLCEYATLNSRCNLTDAEADRIQAILEQAENEPVLYFLIDEIDHLLAHKFNLINPRFIQDQQEQLETKLNQNWMEQLLLDLETEPSSNQGEIDTDKIGTDEIDRLLLDLQTRSLEFKCKEFQKYLQSQGFYDGQIDGLYGPKTKAAIDLLQQENNLDSEKIRLIQSTICSGPSSRSSGC